MMTRSRIRSFVVALLLHLSLVILLGLGLPSVAMPVEPVGWVLLLAPEFLLGAGLGRGCRLVAERARPAIACALHANCAFGPPYLH